MKKNNSDKSPGGNIDYLLSLISGHDINQLSGIFLDETLMEFFYLKNEIHVPPVPAGELDSVTAAVLTEKLIETIPGFLYKHTLLEKRKPPSEQHSLHFIRKIPGRLIDFVHILRLDFKLSGVEGRITGKGDSRTFPPYSTDRIKYKSRLVPVIKESDPPLIDSVRIKSQLNIENSEKRITSVFFDEFSTSEISIDFSTKAGSDIYSIPVKIYQFISYDYFTACLNIPDPAELKLENAAAIFEPLFFYLYYQYRDEFHETDGKRFIIWDEFLEVTGSGIEQKILLREKLKDFFSGYTLYRDDNMMLKGLRKIIISG